MGATRKPRRRYVQRPVDLLAHDTAMALATVLRPSQRRELEVPAQAALDGLRTGSGGWPAWCALADALNVAEQLAQRGIASDRMPEILAAQAVLSELHARQAQRGSWTLRAAE